MSATAKHKKERRPAGSPAATEGLAVGQSASHGTASRIANIAAHAGAPASVARRFFAYLIDWYAGALCSAVPISIVAARFTGDITNQYLVDYPSPYGLIAGAAALLCAFLYYVAIPLIIWPGQTPGKRLCGIRIELSDGRPVDFPHLVLRQVLGVVIIEGVITNASGIWHQMATIVTGVNVVHPLMYVGFAVTAVSCGMILIRRDHRCLHDLIGGTRVTLVERGGRSE